MGVVLFYNAFVQGETLILLLQNFSSRN